MPPSRIPGRLLPAALLIAAGALGAAGAPAAAEGAAQPATRRGSATVSGRIEVSRALTARRPRFRIYADPGASVAPPAREDATADERRNIVVYIERVPGATTAGTRRASMRQHSERFVPHVLPVVRGTTVDFPNDDPLYHNVFSLSRARSFDLGRYPRGHSRAATFDRAGAVQVFCHIHADMSAVVLVLENPYFAIPDATGEYVIPDLPPGDYTLVAWHERIRPIRHALHVADGQRARVDFRIPLPAVDAARER